MTNLKDWQDSLLEHQELTSNAKFVGLTISRYLGKSGLIFPSLQTISELTSNTILTVRKAIENLQEKGFVKVEKEKITKQGGYKNSYKLFLNNDQVLKNNILENNTINNNNNNNINDMINNMSNDMLNDMLINILKNNTEVYEYILSYLKKENKGKFNNNNNKNTEKFHYYEGNVIKLNKADFEKWQSLYKNLDLEVELYTRDMWLSANPQKNWFISTAQYLANKNKESKPSYNKPYIPKDF